MDRLSRASLWAVLLLIGTARHYGYYQFPDEVAGMASKGLGAFTILCLLAMVYQREAWPVFLWWAWEELQVVICSVLYIREPWPVMPGRDICSALVGLELSAVGVLLVAALLVKCQVLQVRESHK